MILKRMVCLFVMGLFLFVARAQTPALTAVKDTVYKSDGSLASGTVVITWNAFITADSKPVFGGTKTVPLTSGALVVGLIPNAGSTPSGTSYNVKYFQTGGSFFEEIWIVPSSSPLANPAQPISVTQTGTPGTTTYYYWCTATNANGETLLSPSRVTTTSNATLSGTNYNVITCATVASATGYKAYRTTTSTAPTGTGNYLVGSSATTTINDQSNTLTSAAIPAVNTTDPKTLSVVRVAIAPSPSVIFNPSQVQGTAIVQTPLGAQTITAASTASAVPLAIKGKAGNSGNVFEVYDNSATPALKGYFTPSGLLTLNTPLGLGSGGTNQAAWTASRCVRVNTAGTALEAFSADCGVPNAHNLLSASHGDTVAASPVLGDLLYGNATPAWQRLAGNTTSAKNFLTQTGTGAVSAAPAWAAIADGDIPATIARDSEINVQGTASEIISSGSGVAPVLSLDSTVAQTDIAKTWTAAQTFKVIQSTMTTVSFSATPTFDASLGNSFKITLTGNVTSSTLSNAQAGEDIQFIICQDATGSRTFVWPTNVKGGMVIGGTLNTCSAQTFEYDGTNAYAVSSGVTNM